MGELIGFAKVTRDVTERRNAATALQKAQETLFQSQKMEAIGQLTGGVAHDFNNLLSVILNGLTVLRREIQSDYGIKILDSMERAATRGATLNQQLLTFARQQPYSPEKHNLNRVISSFEAVLRRANTGSTNFEIDLGSPLPLVMIDAPQFETALLNLIVNARDATPEGGLIKLSTEAVMLHENEIKVLPAGRYVKITVADNGQGMQEETIKRAIEPFFTTKAVGKGTGLGLSQVYGFIQQAKGEVDIKSELGKGTQVSLYVPALEEIDKSGPTNQGLEKALVVDDQPDVLEMAVEVFRSLGYDVISAGNGEEAYQILQATPDIEVLFSDVVMPGMNGIELGKKARDVIPNIKIILASGYAGPALKVDNAALNEFQFIPKPYRIAEIVKKLRVAG